MTVLAGTSADAGPPVRGACQALIARSRCAVRRNQPTRIVEEPIAHTSAGRTYALLVYVRVRYA